MFGSKKNNEPNRTLNAAFGTDTSADILGFGGSYSARIPDSVRQIIAKQEIQLRRIQIMKDIYQNVLDQLGNYVVPENLVGDTYYITLKYKSSKFYDTVNKTLHNSVGSNRKPVYVFCGPAINSNPSMDMTANPNLRRNQTCQGICVWLTTDETFYQDDNKITDKLVTDTGFDYAGRRQSTNNSESWNDLYDRINTPTTSSPVPTPIFTPGTDTIPDAINPAFDNALIANVNTNAALDPLRNGTDASKHFLKCWAPYVYNLTKLDGSTLPNNDLLTHFPIDKESLSQSSDDRPKVIYSSLQHGTYLPLTGSRDPNTWDPGSYKYYNNPHTLTDANDIGPIFNYPSLTPRMNKPDYYTVYDPLKEIDKFWREVIEENPKMGPRDAPIDVNFHEFKGNNLLNPALLTRFTNARIREGLLSKDIPGNSFKGPIAELVNQLEIFDTDPIRYQFCLLLSWLMGLENNGGPLQTNLFQLIVIQVITIVIM